MKQFTKFIGPALVAAATFVSPYASAGPFDTDGAVFHGSYTYVGSLNPSTFESVSLASGSYGPGFFDHLWVFDIAPAGNGSASVTFQPNTGISGLNVEIFAVAPGGAGTCALAVGDQSNQCSGFPTMGALVPTTNTNSPVNFAQAVSNNFLAAGRYIVQVTGTALVVNGLGTGNSYGGAIAVNPIPEPGSLALVGVALLGAAASLRKRKSA